MNFNVFNDSSKSYLEIEQELLDSGEIENEDDLARLYPNVIGDQHRDTCMCPKCDPDDQIQIEEEEEEYVPLWEREPSQEGMFILDHEEYDPNNPTVYQGAFPRTDEYPF